MQSYMMIPSTIVPSQAVLPFSQINADCVTTTKSISLFLLSRMFMLPWAATALALKPGGPATPQPGFAPAQSQSRPQHSRTLAYNIRYANVNVQTQLRKRPKGLEVREASQHVQSTLRTAWNQRRGSSTLMLARSSARVGPTDSSAS